MNLLIRRLISTKMSKKIYYPSAERNKFFILEVLQKYIDLQKPAKMLEIASGTGQHAAYFAAKLPGLIIQPSEVDLELFDSIKAYAAEIPNNHVQDPFIIDASTGPWQVSTSYDYIVNVNMFHVTPFTCTIGFFKYSSQVLKNGGLIFTYGAYAIDGVIQPQSNIDFDNHIRQRDPCWGVRDIRDLQRLAAENGITLKQLYDLPANNKCIVWEKTG